MYSSLRERDAGAADVPEVLVAFSQCEALLGQVTIILEKDGDLSSD